MMKHEQVLINLIELKLVEFKEIDFLVNALGDKAIRQLIMKLTTTSRDAMLMFIKR